MPIEIYGRICHPDESGTNHDKHIKYDLSSIPLKIRCFEDRNFDGIYLGCGRGDPDPIILAGYASALTNQLKFLLGHRAGSIAPTMAARKIATLDHLTAGKLAVQMVADDDAGLDGAEAQLGLADHAEKSAEYVGIINAISSADQPIDHTGKYYRLHNGYSEIKPLQTAGVPIHPDGAAPMAENGVVPCADIWRARHFALCLQDEAGQTDEPHSVRAPEQGSDLGIPLVGTADQIIAALMEHYDDGVRRFILAGLGAAQDMLRIGNEIVPHLRERVAQRDAERGIG